MSNLGFIPSWQFSLDANTNPALTPFVTYPPGMTQTTVQPVGPYYNTKLAGLAGLAGMTASPTMAKAYTILSAVGGILGAYHGYKRNRGSIGWAIGWSLLGGAFAPLTVPIMFAQGIGKPK